MKLNERRCKLCDRIVQAKGLCLIHYNSNNYDERLKKGDITNVRAKQRTWVRGRNDRGDYGNYYSPSVTRGSDSLPNLSRLQLMWLYSRGGRTIDDVIEVNEDYFILMRSRNSYVPVIVPSDNGIHQEYSIAVSADNIKVLRNRNKVIS